jgi:hypothetical protein
VLPLWRGGIYSEKKQMEEAVENLLSYVSQKSIVSVSMDDVGVMRFGFPR